MPRQCWFFCFLSQKMGEPAREKKVGDNLGARGKDSIFPDAVRGR